MRRQPSYREDEGYERGGAFPVAAYGEDNLANSSAPPRIALNPLMEPPMPISTLELSLGDVLL
jgi:hypothetical protein